MKRALVVLAAALVVAPPAASVTDTTPPTIDVTSPARGEFVSGSGQVTVEGTATDDESGIASVTVNGAPALLDRGTGAWSAPVTLEFGTNILTGRATDGAGNETFLSWSYLYSPTYLPLGELVPSALAFRLGEDALSALPQQILGSEAFQHALAAAEPLPGHIVFGGMACGSTTGRAAPLDARLAIELTSLDCILTGTGPLGQIVIDAAQASAEGVLVLVVENGRFVAAMPMRPSVDLVIRGSSKFLPEPLVEVALSLALQQALPPALESVLEEANGPHMLDLPGLTLTSTFRPAAIDLEPGVLKAFGDADVSAVADRPPHQPPGSPSRNGATSPPPFTSQHDFAVSLREDLLNRALTVAWASGAGTIRIDQAYLMQSGFQLPFPLDASFLAEFFPALGTLPPGTPIAFMLEPMLPAVVEVTGAPSLLSVGLGELGLSVQLDLGQGWVDLLALVVHAEMPADVMLAPPVIQLTPGNPTRLVVDVISNPFGLAQADIDQFLRTALPLTVDIAPGLIPPIPLPSFPSGLQPTNVDVRQDGAGADFITIEGDV
ncbi:MAG: Ig-like domain-containing protein [Gaiellaceae bacterium]